MDFNEIERRLAEYDRAAGMFVNQILTVAALWDDLIDRDKPVSGDEINRAFEIMLIDLPRNSFYRRNFNELNPILVVAIQNWHMATKKERNSQSKLSLEVSFVIRSSYVDLITMSAYLLGGNKLAAEIGEAARAFAHDEGMANYLFELDRERINREGA